MVCLHWWTGCEKHKRGCLPPRALGFPGEDRKVPLGASEEAARESGERGSKGGRRRGSGRAFPPAGLEQRGVAGGLRMLPGTTPGPPPATGVPNADGRRAFHLRKPPRRPCAGNFKCLRSHALPRTGSFAMSATSRQAIWKGRGPQQKLQLPECSAGLPVSGERTGVCLHRRLCGRVPSAGRVRALGPGSRGLDICPLLAGSVGVVGSSPKR